MTTLSTLNPNSLWSFFSQICAIPHPSKHEAALSLWIQQWANSEGLTVKEDKVGNLIIKKPATPGMENRKGVILQAHIDMVPQANAATRHDFTRDPIQPYVDGEWVRARGTTLGADNGIGAAACLAVLADKRLKHGPLEVLLTVDEEAGMGGAFGLEAGWLEGEILLNTDSEQDGEVYMGCAGGINANIRFPVARVASNSDASAYTLTIKGLRGGHSGVNIHQERGNANKLIARLIHGLQQTLPVQLSQIDGGTLRNAIPREASALIAIPAAEAARLVEQVALLRQELQEELKEVDAGLEIDLIQSTLPATVMAPDAQQRLLYALLACPNGVIRMNQAIAGVVETSTNLGIITTTEDQIQIQCLIRSLNQTGRHYVEQMILSLFTLAGAECHFDGAYPGWAPDPASPIMQLLQQSHTRLFGYEPKIMVIHAGLECGLFKSAYPHWDMVSFGPTIQGAHSPDERVHIPAVEHFWQLLCELLTVIPQKA